MSDQIEETPKKAKKAEAPAFQMDAMNLEAIHRRIDKWGVAAVIGPLVNAQRNHKQCKAYLDRTLEATDAIMAILARAGTEGKAE